MDPSIEVDLPQASLRASFWTILSHAANQGIRFLGNLLLTRLLFPEDFGLMQLTFVFIQGISMFSDLGILPNLIQHPKGNDPRFLRTAWTIQLSRGVFIECAIILFAYPLAVLYKAPQLAWLIPLAGINAIIDGSVSTNLIMNYRKMEMRKIAILDITAQIVGMIAMLMCAWYWRSVWTLLISSFVSGMIKTTASQFIFSGPKMKFAWSQEYVRDIVKFGKWVFVGSMAGFLLSRFDRVILGFYLSLTELGIYGIAFAIANVFVDVMLTLNEKVLIPFYTHAKTKLPHEMIRHVLKIRTLLLLFSLPILLIIMVYSQQIIDLLYPKAYIGAGWMLKILAVGSCYKCISLTIGPIFYASGDSFRPMIVTLISAAILVLAIMIQGHYFGTAGVIWAIPVAELLSYPIIVIASYRYGTWLPWLDLSAFFIVTLMLLLSL